MTTTCTMILGDCLEVMPELSQASVDLCFADLPYGVTGFDWDRTISLDAILPQITRLVSDRGPWIATGNEPFHLSMVAAWKRHFRYSLIWEKFAPCNFLQARLRPMVSHEFVGVYGKTPVYNPQKTYGHKPAKKVSERAVSNFIDGYKNTQAGKRKDLDDSRHPRSILCFRRDKRVRRSQRRPDRASTHPSQKPVALISWLVRSYSKACDTVLDPVSGSGTTAVSAIQNGRSVTCIEKDEGYFDASVERVKKTITDGKLDVELEVRR